MTDQNLPNENAPQEPVLEAETVPTEAPREIIPAAEFDLPVRKGYQNRTARMLNGVFIVSLVIMIAYFLFQAVFSMYSYLQQGAPASVAVLYTLVSLAVPIIFCFFPFLFKFFAEVVELLDRNR